MTKKYRVKIDTPWARKGAVFQFTKYIENGPYKWFSNCGMYGFEDDPRDYPHIFEQDPVEKLAEWICKKVFGGDGTPKQISTWAAKEFLDAGLDPERLV